MSDKKYSILFEPLESTSGIMCEVDHELHILYDCYTNDVNITLDGNVIALAQEVNFHASVNELHPKIEISFPNYFKLKADQHDDILIKQISKIKIF